MTRDWHEIVRYLSDLKYDTNLVLDLAHDRQHEIAGAINWADLRCVEARYCLDEHGNEYYEVSIEEAAPSNVALYSFVVADLEERGHKNVVVGFDW